MCGRRQGQCLWFHWMNGVTSNRSMTVISPDKLLQRELSNLSKRMPSCMVQQISDCLCRSHALTDYEVQVIHSKNTELQQAVCLLQTLLHKGRTACLLFFQCLKACNTSLFQTVTRGLVKVTDEAHHHVEKSFSEASGTVPSCVININNASLNNCIIGNNNSLCCLQSQTDVIIDAVEQTQRSHQQRQTPDSREAPNVQVESSNVEFVIIGDNNYMNIESSLNSDEEETDCVPEDLGE